MIDSTKTNEPLYKQIYNELLQKIIHNEYHEGDILPSEPALQNMYGVSRITIRRAMDILQTNGYVKKHSGIGTIVMNTKHGLQLKKISSFSEDNLNRDALSELVSFDIVDAPLQVVTKLHLREDVQVYKIERLRIINGEKVGFHRSFIPIDKAEITQNDMASPQASLYQILREHNIRLTTANETIEAMSATSMLQDQLELEEHATLLYIERCSFDRHEGIEFAEIYYRADRYKYHVELEGE